MPGGRLTQRDREDIAEGLAEGLGYTEIARRLGRPTSTVSREVARNGGPERYHADRAQRATGQRARRARPTPPAPRHGDLDDGRDALVVRALEDRFTEQMVQTGFPRMMARVLVSLFTSDTEGRTAAELAQRLQVSPGSISKVIQPLEHIGLLRRERAARGRRDRYLLDRHLGVHAWTTNAHSILLWAQEARHGAEVLGVDTPAGARMAEMAQFLDLAHRGMMTTVEHWLRRHPRR